MASVAPPGSDPGGHYWRLESSPRAPGRGSRRGATLVLAALAVAIGAFALLSAARGGAAKTVSPIAEAATATAQEPGARMTFTATASPALSRPLRMHGHGAFNGQTQRASVVGRVTGYGLHARAVARSQGTTTYERSPCIAAALPKGKTWMEVRPFR